MAVPARDPSTPAADSSPTPDGEHLSPETVYELIEKRLSRRKLRAAEAHLAACSECVETLAMVIRAERPASREEQQILAAIPEPTPTELLGALRPHIGPPARRNEWKTVVVAVIVGALLVTVGSFLRKEYWLPAQSRRAATDALRTIVELRQATGRLPLRYITEFERAGIVRSGFDTTDDAENAVIENLRSAVERAPDLDAMTTLGLLLIDEGELEEAESLLTRVREARPDSVDAVNGLAVVYFEQARRDAANAYALQQKGLALLRRAEALDPDDPRVLYNYGMFYEALGMGAAADKAWERYLNHDQTSQWAEQAMFELSQ